MEPLQLEITLDNLNESAAKFLELVKPVRQFAFYGSMGAGKTTFIAALCHQLQSTDMVSSPTFSIVNEYNTLTNDTIYHFDFYRITNSVELFDIGFEEYLENQGWCFIEWPEKAQELIPDSFARVFISSLDEGKRLLKIFLQ